MSISNDNTIIHWCVTRRDQLGEPICLMAVVGNIRLQVYRHIARRDRWTAHAYRFLFDVILAAKNLDEARTEAITLLHIAQGQREEVKLCQELRMGESREPHPKKVTMAEL